MGVVLQFPLHHVEKQLPSTNEDYAIAPTVGNWVAAAGMTGGRLNQFNIVKQSRDYDDVRCQPEPTSVCASWQQRDCQPT